MASRQVKKSNFRAIELNKVSFASVRICRKVISWDERKTREKQQKKQRLRQWNRQEAWRGRGAEKQRYAR